MKKLLIGLSTLLVLLFTACGGGSSSNESIDTNEVIDTNESIDTNEVIDKSDVYITGNNLYMIQDNRENDLDDLYRYDEAVQYCQDLNLSGYTDWILVDERVLSYVSQLESAPDAYVEYKFWLSEDMCESPDFRPTKPVWFVPSVGTSSTPSTEVECTNSGEYNYALCMRINDPSVVIDVSGITPFYADENSQVQLSAECIRYDGTTFDATFDQIEDRFINFASIEPNGLLITKEVAETTEISISAECIDNDIRVSGVSSNFIIYNIN